MAFAFLWDAPKREAAKRRSQINTNLTASLAAAALWGMVVLFERGTADHAPGSALRI
jgi:hypothetical protein